MYKANIEGNATCTLFETLVPSLWDVKAASWMLPSSLWPIPSAPSSGAMGSWGCLVCQECLLQGYGEEKQSPGRS